MKQLIPVKQLTLTVVALTFMCLSAVAGGEHYTIYLNKKLVLVKHISEPLSVMSLLDKTGSNDEIVIHYSHCGKQGNNRRVALTNEKGAVVKEWTFTDAKEGMSIPAKEIAALQQKHGQLTLSYSSRELPAGRALASLSGKGRSFAFLPGARGILPFKWMTI